MSEGQLLCYPLPSSLNYEIYIRVESPFRIEIETIFRQLKSSVGWQLPSALHFPPINRAIQ